ncbi:hypothetical protein ACG74X_10925 [Marivita sp. S0852]|uniref:hypothetical protein n=1 Tax=Marivita sp. S0852 TaxID=3373893 RepID=UPI003982A16B
MTRFEVPQKRDALHNLVDACVDMNDGYDLLDAVEQCQYRMLFDEDKAVDGMQHRGDLNEILLTQRNALSSKIEILAVPAKA